MFMDCQCSSENHGRRIEDKDELIPIALTFDRSRPPEIGKGTDAARFGKQGVPDPAAGLYHRLGGWEDAAGEIAVTEVLPDPLDGIQIGAVGRQATNVRLAGMITSSLICHPALSISTRACVRGGTWLESSANNLFMPSVEACSRTNATPVSRSRQTPPKMQAER